MSHDLLKMVSDENAMAQMPLVTLVDYTKNIQAFGKGIAEFAGLQVISYLNQYKLRVYNNSF